MRDDLTNITLHGFIILPTEGPKCEHSVHFFSLFLVSPQNFISFNMLQNFTKIEQYVITISIWCIGCYSVKCRTSNSSNQ